MMIPNSRVWLFTLRLGLLFSTVGWGMSFFFTFAPWEVAADQLDGMGAGPIPYNPLADYWLKMASSVFGCIGIASAIACARPKTFATLIGLLGPFHLVIGATLVIAAWRNHLDPDLHPTFIPDIVFCFATGMLIGLPLICARKKLPDA